MRTPGVVKDFFATQDLLEPFFVEEWFLVIASKWFYVSSFKRAHVHDKPFFTTSFEPKKKDPLQAFT